MSEPTYENWLSDAYGSDTPLIDFTNFDVPLVDYSNFGAGVNFDLPVDDMSWIGVQSLADILEGEKELDIDALANIGGGGVDWGGIDVASLSPEAFYGVDPNSLPLADYSSLYGSPEDVAKMLDQDQGWSMGAAGRYGVQDLGIQEDPSGYLKLSGYDEGRLPSQWQTVGDSDLKVMVQDDGSAIGMNTATGTSFGLEQEQVQNLVNQGLINTYKSGYFTATGGSKVAPGGGLTTTKDGKTYTLKPDGKVYDTDTGKVITNTNTIKEVINQIRTTGGAGGVSTQPGMQPNMLSSLLPLLLMMMAMRNQGGGSGASSAVIPALTATQKQTPYTQQQQAPGYRPGQGGITYFNPVQYAPRMAGGGIVDLARMLAAQRRAKGGRLLQGKGDGVSDSIPAMIGSDQPARLARGEYVVDARTVAELGNGSTDAGAERLDEMRKRVHAKRKKAGVGQDSKAYKHLPA